VELEVVPALLAAMHAHFQSQALVAAAWTALCVLATSCVGSIDSGWVPGGAEKLVLRSLEHYIHVPSVLSLALCAVAVGAGAHPGYRASVLLTARQPVLTAVRAFAGDTVVLARGFAAIEALARERMYTRVFGKLPAAAAHETKRLQPVPRLCSRRMVHVISY
jgi:hypothetical protein